MHDAHGRLPLHTVITPEQMSSLGEVVRGRIARRVAPLPVDRDEGAQLKCSMSIDPRTTLRHASCGLHLQSVEFGDHAEM